MDIDPQLQNMGIAMGQQGGGQGGAQPFAPMGVAHDCEIHLRDADERERAVIGINRNVLGRHSRFFNDLFNYGVAASVVRLDDEAINNPPGSNTFPLPGMFRKRAQIFGKLVSCVETLDKRQDQPHVSAPLLAPQELPDPERHLGFWIDMYNLARYYGMDGLAQETLGEIKKITAAEMKEAYWVYAPRKGNNQHKTATNLNLAQHCFGEMYRCNRAVPDQDELWRVMAKYVWAIQLVLDDDRREQLATDIPNLTGGVKGFNSAFSQVAAQYAVINIWQILPPKKDKLTKNCKCCGRGVSRSDITERATNPNHEYLLVNPFDGANSFLCQHCGNHCGLPWDEVLNHV